MNIDRSPTRQSRRTVRIALFLGVQVLLVGAVAAAVTARDRHLQRELALPTLRSAPLKVAPRYDRPDVVSDEQLLHVLDRLQPRLRGAKPKINYVDHALRFWGTSATFADPAALSGEELRTLLVDHQSFAANWIDEPALLRAGSHGLEVRTREGNATASHVDHTMAGLAEIGTPLDFPLHTTAGPSSMQALVEGSLRRFSLNQAEYEWSILTYALFVPPQTWRSSEGELITFDRLAQRLLREPLRQGVCFGNHRLHALVVLLSIDDQQPLLSPVTRKKIVEHLQNVTALLVQHQHAYGYWDGAWPTTPASDSADRAELANRLLATGHALEWWALAPAEVLPPRETLVRAGQWLSQSIAGLDDAAIEKNYTFLTHAGHALALWRGSEPANFLRNTRESE